MLCCSKQIRAIFQKRLNIKCYCSGDQCGALSSTESFLGAGESWYSACTHRPCRVCQPEAHWLKTGTMMHANASSIEAHRRYQSSARAPHMNGVSICAYLMDNRSPSAQKHLAEGFFSGSHLFVGPFPGIICCMPINMGHHQNCLMTRHIRLPPPFPFPPPSPPCLDAPRECWEHAKANANQWCSGQEQVRLSVLMTLGLG